MRALCAERRWVMSGTPAKGTSVQLGLSSLYGLLSFVGHPVCADGGRVVEQAQGGLDLCAPLRPRG